mgnify:CR=1 FL=1
MKWKSNYAIVPDSKMCHSFSAVISGGYSVLKVKFCQSYWPIVLILLLLPQFGCQMGSGIGGDPTPVPTRLSARLECEAELAAECELVVEVRALDDDVLLDIQTYAEYGVRFLNNNEVATVNQRNGRIQNVRLRAQGSRLIHFPYQIRDAQLPGEYRVYVSAYHPNLPEVPETLRNEVYAQTDLLVYIIMTEAGELRLVGSQAVFDQRYGFGAPGSAGTEFWFALPEENAGQSGLLYICLKSDWLNLELPEAYAPRVQLNAVDGIDFGPGSYHPVEVSADRKTASFQLPSMGEDESRVVMFPLNVDTDGRQLDGVYTFIATLAFRNTEGLMQVESERLPVGIQVDSDPDAQSKRVMVVHGIPGAAVTPTVDPNATATSTPTQTPFFDPNIAVGGMPTPTSTPTLTPIPPNANCQNLTADNGRHTISWEWQRRDLSGNLCQYYLTQVHNRLPISWEQFRGEALLYNPQLVVDGEVFYPEKWYQLPEMEE